MKRFEISFYKDNLTENKVYGFIVECSCIEEADVIRKAYCEKFNLFGSVKEVK